MSHKKKPGAKMGRPLGLNAPRQWKKHPTGRCGVLGCGNKHFVHDMCQHHWQREVAKHGPVLAKETKAPAIRQPNVIASRNRASREMHRRGLILSRIFTALGDKWFAEPPQGAEHWYTLRYADKMVRMLTAEYLMLERSLWITLVDRSGLTGITEKGQEILERIQAESA